MVVFSGSEVVHVPRESGIMGQLPFTDEARTNRTWLPGAGALWSAEALSGVMTVVIEQESLAAAAQRVARKIQDTCKPSRQRMAISEYTFYDSHFPFCSAIHLSVLTSRRSSGNVPPSIISSWKVRMSNLAPSSCLACSRSSRIFN